MEWALAAHWWGYQRIEDFEALDTEEQAKLIAVYRAQAQMEAVVAHEQSKDAKRKQRTTKKSGGKPGGP